MTAAVDRGGGHSSLAHRLWRLGAAHVSTGNRVALLRDGLATYGALVS